MIKFAANEYVRMNEALQQVALRSENDLQKAEQSYQSVQSSVQELKKFIQGYTFKDQQEEIQFFKEIKPQFMRELIYFTELFYIEANKPIGDKEILEAYYKQVMQRNRIFFDRNQLLYTYYRSGKTIYDAMFFLREADALPLLPEYLLDIDPRFSTVQSFRLSKLQAFELLHDYLNKAIYILDHPAINVLAGEDKKHKNLWTDSKASLIELAYALHSRGSVNNGRGDVKQIITDLEVLFNVEVGNFYRTFQGMRIRKKNRTAYLDTLKESLEKRMDETDMNFG